jgi:hypothetical protein
VHALDDEDDPEHEPGRRGVDGEKHGVE